MIEKEYTDLIVYDVSDDGRQLLLSAPAPDRGWDLFLVPLGDPGAEPVPWLQTPYGENGASFSPNGRYIAYVNDESGQEEVYVGATEDSTRRLQISRAGGFDPCWSPDGDRLFYRAEKGQLMEVPIDTSSQELHAGAPKPLFEIPEIPGFFSRNGYDVAAGGERFLVALGVEDDSIGIRVRTSWYPGESL